jgi:small subunit ribosomal protein S5
MGLATPKVPAQELFKRYNDKEKAALPKIYTPEQIKVIEAGEEAIDPEDLDRRGIIRTDLGALPYLDDFSRLRPVIDKKPQYNRPIDPNARFMTPEELSAASDRALKKVQAEFPNPMPANMEKMDDPDDEEWLKFRQRERLIHAKAEEETEVMMGTNGPLPWEPDLLAPSLPAQFIEDEAPKAKKENADEEDVRDPDGIYNRLRKQTGYTLDDIFNLKVKILVKHRVVNQTRLGKIASLYCLAVAGNENGRLGIGEAKGQETEETQNNARISAIRNMQPIPRYEERTIFGEVEGKVSAVEVKLMARPPGTFDYSVKVV